MHVSGLVTMGQVVDAAPEIASFVVAMAVILGILYRFVMLPNLRRDLVEPLEKVREQVTRNGGSSMADRVGRIETHVDTHGETLSRIESQMLAQDGKWEHWREDHMRWANAQLHLLWSHMLEDRARDKPPPPPGIDGPFHD